VAPTQVTLVIPTAPEFLRLARLASTDAGSRAGLDYEEIDDLRMAVSELCYLLIGEGRPGSVTLQFSIDGDEVAVDGSTPGPVPETTGNDFTDLILETVTDFHEIVEEGDGRRFRVVKRRRS
jgi:serine/threonine-protein kinase RsbW